MKKNEKRMILILLLILAVIIIVAVVMGNGKKDSSGEQENGQLNPNNGATEEFVQKLDDGTRLNTSNKLKETKKFESFELSDIKLTEKDNITLLLGTIKNVSSKADGEYPLNVQILDKDGKEITTIGAYVQKLEPGQSTQLNASATFDYANAYDIVITKAE